jgi:hypothetical protein
MKKNTKRTYTRKMRGGDFNPAQKEKLTMTLKNIWGKSKEQLDKKELNKIMVELGKGSQFFSRSTGLKQLRQQIEPLNKEQFKIWLKNIYPLFVEDADETDFESVSSTNSTSSSASM